MILFDFILSISTLSSRPMVLGTAFSFLLSNVKCFAPTALAFKIAASMFTVSRDLLSCDCNNPENGYRAVFQH